MRQRRSQPATNSSEQEKKKVPTRTRSKVHIDLTGFDVVEGIIPPEHEWTEEQRKILTKPLTIRETMVVHEYLKDFKMMAALRRAGSKAKYSDTSLFKRPHIRYAIHKKIRQILEDKTELAAKTLGELEIVGRSDITDFIVIGKGDQVTKIKDLEKIDTRAIAAIEVDEELNLKRKVIERKVKLKLWDKPRTLDTLSKVTNLQQNTLQLNGELKVNVSIEDWKTKCKERLLQNQEEKKKEFEEVLNVNVTNEC